MRIRAAFLLALGVTLGACQSAPDLSRLRERPEDFTVAATVYNPQSGRTGPRGLRPGRFILEADSVLRWSPGATQRGFAPPIRTLTPGQAEEIWDLARDSGLLEPDSIYRVYGPVQTDEGALTTPVALIEIAFAGMQTASRVPLDRSSDEAVLAQRLIDRLAELAFIRQ